MTILSKEKVMTSAKKTAYHFRLAILIIGILFTLAGIVWVFLPYLNDHLDTNFAGLLGTPLSLPIDNDANEMLYLFNSIFVIGVVLLGQWAFLRPGKNFKVSIAEEGRPMRTSLFAAGLMAMLLTVGLVALVLEFPNKWEPLMDYDNGNRYYVMAAMGVIWGLWTCVFWVYWKQGDKYTQLGKMIRGLVAGSILEVMVAVPAHIWATRQRDCYCCRGTYTTLIFSGTVLIWAFGPGIILLYMREKYRRAKLEGVCPKCGGNLDEERNCPKSG